MKCESCGYSLRIEDSVCPSCGTANPFAKAHRENMERYTEAFEDTQKAVLERTKKTAGAMAKLSICVIMLFIIIALVVIKSNPSIKRNAEIKKVRANIEQYRNEYTNMEANNDYIKLYKWYGYNNINHVPEFSDCLPVFNVCMFYNYFVSYVAEVTNPDYMEYAVGDYEDYCQNIIESYDQMVSYSKKEIPDNEYADGHRACMESALSQSRIIMQAVFKLSDEQMKDFDSLSQNARIALLEENWPYEK